jgi:hypothetical protein
MPPLEDRAAPFISCERIGHKPILRDLLSPGVVGPPG